MKCLDTYKNLNLNNTDEVFEYFISTLRITNRTYDFFVDWNKVFNNINNIEMELNLLNYLIGKDDIKSEFKHLIFKYPSIVSVIPILIAIREDNLDILSNFKTDAWEYKSYSFKRKDSYSEDEINNIIEFCDRIGLLYLFENKKIKNLVDYCIGLEVGIGTNGRKNRGGKIMENIIEWHIDKICTKLNLEYIVQATKSKIKNKWDLKLPVDKSSREYDFAIFRNNKLVLIETNFYTSGGSKLKSVAGEFTSLNNYLLKQSIVDKFIWITDGIGWMTAQLPLMEAFINNDYILNNRMIHDGALEEIILKEND